MDLIIGAGISGLSYVNFCNHDDYLIIDRDSEIGGYCKTINQDGFTWDYSGHFFHFRNNDIKEYLLDRMSQIEILNVKKCTQIYYKGYYIDFPFQKNIHQLPKQEFIDCLYDLFAAEFTEVNSFKQMLYMRYGSSIAEKFLIPYNEKLYACDLDQLDEKAMGRFFPDADKYEIIRNFKNPDNNSYNMYFTYPKSGAIEYVNALYREVNPNKVSLNEELFEVDLINKIAKTNVREIKFDRLISSAPLNLLLDKCGIDYNKAAYSWNKVLVLNLGFDKKGLDTFNHWVYFPEKKFCFYRIGYYDNIFGSERLSLYVEIGFNKDSEVEVDGYLDTVINDLRKAGVITDHKLVSHSIVLMNPAYVHINMESEMDKVRAKDLLSKYDVFSIGRYGDWKYCSIEDNILEAKELATKINTK